MDHALGPVPRHHPGIFYDLSSDHPKVRIQAYLDSYMPREDDVPEVGAMSFLRGFAGGLWQEPGKTPGQQVKAACVAKRC